MENWIERISEPRRLFLAWQAPDHMQDRFRWAVAVIDRTAEGSIQLRYLKRGDEFSALNQGRSFEQLTELGYQGYPAFRMKQETHRENVAAALLRRLPPRSRSDFGEYTTQFRLAPSLSLSDLELLAVTQAQLPSDGFSIVDPLDPDLQECDLMLEVAGLRYYVRDNPLSAGIGDPIDIVPEPDNEMDPNAVQFLSAGRKIGNVNRLQAATFLSWLKHRRVTGTLERLNGRPDRPRAYVFVRVRSAEDRLAA